MKVLSTMQQKEIIGGVSYFAHIYRRGYHVHQIWRGTYEDACAEASRYIACYPDQGYTYRIEVLN